MKRFVYLLIGVLVAAVLPVGSQPPAAKMAVGQKPADLPAMITVSIQVGHSATIIAPSNRITTRPGFLPGTTTIEIDTSK